MELTSQRVQNIVIRDFCNKKIKYELSAAEYSMKNSYLVLSEIIQDMKRIDGIVAFSIFQLPSDNKERINILKKIINKKEYNICFRKVHCKSNKDIIKLNDIWSIKLNTLNTRIQNKLK